MPLDLDLERFASSSDEYKCCMLRSMNVLRACQMVGIVTIVMTVLATLLDFDVYSFGMALIECLFCALLIYGARRKQRSFFVPYMTFSVLVLFGCCMAIVGGLQGLLIGSSFIDEHMAIGKDVKLEKKEEYIALLIASPICFLLTLWFLNIVFRGYRNLNALKKSSNPHVILGDME